MPLQTINNGDSGLVARAKINAAIDAINAMSSTTTSTSTTTAAPTTTSSTTSTTTIPTTTSSTTSTTTIPTTTSSTTSPPTTTSTTTIPTTTSTTTTPGGTYNYQINNCAGGSSYTVTAYSPLSLVAVYKFYAPGAPFDTNACWTLTPSAMGGTTVTPTFSYNDCTECTSGTTTSTSTTTMSTSTTTMYPPMTSTTTMP